MSGFPSALVLRGLLQSVENELQRAQNGSTQAFIAVPDEVHSVLDTDGLTISELATGLGACGAEWRQEDLAVTLICCQPAGSCWHPCHCPPCERTGGGSFAHGWRHIIEKYVL